MNADRRQSLAKTGGRTPRLIPTKTPANEPAGPQFDTNLVQLTSDDKGQIDTSMLMHKFFEHACHCGMEED
jgi:hypothetical protein